MTLGHRKRLSASKLTRLDPQGRKKTVKKLLGYVEARINKMQIAIRRHAHRRSKSALKKRRRSLDLKECTAEMGRLSELLCSLQNHSENTSDSVEVPADATERQEYSRPIRIVLRMGPRPADDSATRLKEDMEMEDKDMEVVTKLDDAEIMVEDELIGEMVGMEVEQMKTEGYVEDDILGGIRDIMLQ
ncbi:hypothetical protein MMC14_008197 [Varicellaria rhodocarpa]|nr:hypothetical protein [Varicellaria rhodocarpa]